MPHGFCAAWLPLLPASCERFHTFVAMPPQRAKPLRLFLCEVTPTHGWQSPALEPQKQSSSHPGLFLTKCVQHQFEALLALLTLRPGRALEHVAGHVLHHCQHITPNLDHHFLQSCCLRVVRGISTLQDNTQTTRSHTRNHARPCPPTSFASSGLNNDGKRVCMAYARTDGSSQKQRQKHI
jgi:hypothetical protein